MPGEASLSIPIAYTQYTVGNASVQFTLRDRYGFVLSSSMTTSYKLPYDPLQVYFTQWPSQIDYYDTGTSRLSISEANYTGNFVVKCSISGSAILYLNNRRIFDGEALDLAAGSHVFELSPRGNGEVSTSFTVTDRVKCFPIRRSSSVCPTHCFIMHGYLWKHLCQLNLIRSRP